jgi:hypothetical protein
MSQFRDQDVGFLLAEETVLADLLLVYLHVAAGVNAMLA